MGCTFIVNHNYKSLGNNRTRDKVEFKDLIVNNDIYYSTH